MVPYIVQNVETLHFHSVRSIGVVAVEWIYLGCIISKYVYYVRALPSVGRIFLCSDRILAKSSSEHTDLLGFVPLYIQRAI